MKRVFILFFAVIIAVPLILSGCTTDEAPKTEKSPQNPAESQDEPATLDEDETDYIPVEVLEIMVDDDFYEDEEYDEPETTEKTEKTTPAVIDYEEYPNLKPLELLGNCYMTEDGIVYTNTDWDKCEPDIFREYMFGMWEGDWLFGELENHRLTIDDTEENFRYNLQWANKYQQKGDTIIFLCGDYQASYYVLWLDINNSNIMYGEIMEGNHGYSNVFTRLCVKKDLKDNIDINIFTKINSAVNEPENGYMSRLRLYELMEEYDIDFEMIFKIEYKAYTEYTGEQPHFFVMDGDFNTLPIYIISEELNKFVFKSKLMWGYGFAYIDVIYTIEKVNGEWVRTIDFDDEQLESASVEIEEWYKINNPQ